ncbi:hypothetical protein CERZMDRAFT_94500 [Cercospora zeae-maydis SCOH1-5]|uniref:Uncharacterized protein n=1 Tax=Cercospora zeae-maydis SCOH1-5 TaxID=717836 RepID=A0A6A6FNR1_9PEZI|nr:hypothetical protein CERZMDRAFT_94500 [Cercospora zeae-maydis SCOH1-5]
MAPTVPYDSHPIMRLVIRITREHFDELAGRDRLAIFNAIFREQLRAAGFVDGGIPSYDTLDSQWRDRSRTERTIAKWEPLLKRPESMTAEELWAYIWLYDVVRLVAEGLGIRGPSTKLLEWQGPDFVLQFNVDNDVWREMMEIREESEQVLTDRSDGTRFIGLTIDLPDEWAGVAGHFTVARPLQ